MSIQTAAQDEEPSTNYTVLSWRQDVLKQSTVGILSANKYANGRWHSTSGGYTRYSTSELFGDKNLNVRSEEHTSELQSLMRISSAVFCLTQKKQIKHI